MCHRHSDKTLEFFCVDCDLVICSSCALTLHRTCAQVNTLKDAAQGKKATIRKFHETFCAHLKRSENVMVGQHKEKRHLQKQYSDEREKIIKHAATLIERTRDEKRLCLAELDAAFVKYSNELDAELVEYQGRVDFLRKSKDSMSSPATYNSAHRVMERYYRKVSDYRRTSHKIQIRKLEFHEHTLDSFPFGKVKTDSGSRPVVPYPETTAAPLLKAKPPLTPHMDPLISLPLTSSEPTLASTVRPQITPWEVSPFHGLVTGEEVLTLERTISLKLRTDDRQCRLCDATVHATAGGVLVVTDAPNLCIKSLCLRTFEMQSKLTMAEKPHGVCTISDNMVAVTVPKARHIAIVSVSPLLTLRKVLKIGLKCWGITAVGTNAFAVSTWCRNSKVASIHIIDIEGHILKCVHNDSRLLVNPMYLCTLDTDKLLVSDCTASKVACLRQNGNVVFTCQSSDACKLERPMAMADDGRGYFVLLDFTGGVCLVDYTGKVKYVLPRGEGITCPRGIAVGQKGAIFIVNENGNVSIFRPQLASLARIIPSWWKREGIYS